MSTQDVRRADLPIKDFDHLPIGSMGHRVRGLDAEDLGLIRRYEAAHAKRPLALQIIDRRLRELADAQPASDGDQPG